MASNLALSVHVIGGGLAGSEASWQLAQAGVPVALHEMRAVRQTEAHLTDRLAELVCSNSFRSDDAMNNAVGLLHEEMRRCGSLILSAADAHKLPAGWGATILATGPLTSPALAEAIRGLTGEESLAFFDAIAPIVHRESIDFSRAWFQSRSDKKGPGGDQGLGGDGADYINCALDAAQYEAFIDELLAGDKTEFKEW